MCVGFVDANFDIIGLRTTTSGLASWESKGRLSVTTCDTKLLCFILASGMEFALFFVFVSFRILDPMVYRLCLADPFMLLLLEEDLACESMFYAVVSPNRRFGSVWSRGVNFTLLHLQQKDEMTWMHQWWDFVRYPWVDLTGLWLLLFIFSFSTTYS